MRYLLTLTLCIWFSSGLTADTIDWEERTLFNANAGGQTLRVLSSTDMTIFAPIINSFVASNPDVTIEYLVASSSDIYDQFRRTPAQFDLIISSAMDLQLKLVNDGYARELDGIVHPDWAQWSNSLFGFSLEPAAIVVNKRLFDALPVPRTRQEMIDVLRANPSKFTTRIGTYDVRQSGLGYLFATQDARSSETYWRLMEIMGGLEARLYCCSAEMIEDVASGTIAIAYNVLGSYALAREDLADKIEVVLPADFPTTMMRTVFVAAETAQADAASAFVRFLSSSSWQSSESNRLSLPPLQTGTEDTQQSVIALGPGLMIFLDRMKRQAFIKEWEDAVIQ